MRSKLIRMRLDQQGRQELAGRVDELLEELAQIQAESAERIASAPDVPVCRSTIALVPIPWPAADGVVPYREP